MCGILAVSGPRGTLPDDEAMRRALATMMDRGPDGEGLCRESVGDVEFSLGHRRLAITGVANGGQPLVTQLAVATVNGEFYAYESMRSWLKARGHVFTTESDSEVLPQSFDAAMGQPDEYGGPGRWTHDLCGEWSFALVDRRDGTLWAACDPSGTKPLRWWRSADGRTVMVASTARALFELGVPRELDEEALRFAMTYQYLPSGRTLFKGVGMLPPGCWLRARNGEIITGRLTSRLNLPWISEQTRETCEASLRPEASRRDRTRAVRLLVEGAVTRRIPAERSFCTHLSGGVDSAIVTALAQQASGKRISGYCAGFPWAPDGQGDETPFAEISAKAMGAELRRVPMSPAELIRAMDEAPKRSESLAINMHAGAKILVAEAVRADGYVVALTGEGADEAFLGYEHFREDFAPAFRPADLDVNPLTVGIMRPAGAGGPDLSGLKALLGGRIPTWVRMKAAASDPLTAVMAPRLRDAAFLPEDLARSLPQGMLADLAAMSDVGQARVLWSHYCMSGYILRGLDDPMGMARGIESRLPFLDASVQDYAARVRDGQHYGADGLEKGLLREAMSDLLPAEVLRRPKRAFLAPSLLGMEIGANWARERLLGGQLVTSGLFDAAGMQALLAAPPRPVRDAAVITLATLSLLIEEFSLR